MKKLQSHAWLFSIVAGLLIIAISIPAYFTSAVSSPEVEVTPPLQPRELTTTNVTTPRNLITRAEAMESLQAGIDIQPLLEPSINSPAFLDVTSEFIRSTDPALDNPPVPDRIEIPAISLSAPVIPAEHTFTKVEGSTFGQWLAPGFFAAGWHPDSSLPGEVGNTVINGHHNIDGEVFANLVDVKEGDIIIVYAGERAFKYEVTNRMILPETFMDAATRLENARWLARSNDVRLTLVTCWPRESYTHRLILVAVPVE
jgi:LPXTG-site transpeptidase (sortase) family protein